jgi:hypothetical protein
LRTNLEKRTGEKCALEGSEHQHPVNPEEQYVEPSVDDENADSIDETQNRNVGGNDLE